MVTWLTLPPVVTGAVLAKRRKGKAPPPLGSWRRGPTPCCAGRRRHRLTGAVLNPHLSTQRALKTDAGRTLLLLVFQVLESGHVHWEPYLLYRKQQFTVACPALTGPEHPKYRASNGPGRRRALRPEAWQPVYPAPYFCRPQAKARSKADAKRLFSY